jgi:outer membrane protein assembly factor BamB
MPIATPARIVVVNGVLAAVFGAVAWGQAETPGPGAAAQEWPQFLGPERNGISHETGLLSSWPTEGPPDVWRVPGGEGMSGLAIRGGKLFTLVQKGGKQWAVCLNAATGEPLWETDVAPAFRNAMGDGPRATPAVAGDTVYVFTGEGVLAALRTADGNAVWKKNIVTDLGGKPADYGMACSPLLVGDKVIVTVGAPRGTVAAVDGKSGEIAWTAGRNQPAGYSSPAVRKVAGSEQLVVFHGAGVLGLEPATGAELWSYPYETDFNCNIAAPLAVGGGVFISSGENHGSVLLALRPRDKSFEVSETWSSLGRDSVLRNEWQTSILLDGCLYGFDNVGSAGPTTHLTCIDAATGERKWQQLRFGKGNLIAADGKLFCSTVAGELVVLRTNPEKYEELGRKEVLSSTRQAPALANGLLYLRDDREIVCLDVRGR